MEESLQYIVKLILPIVTVIVAVCSVLKGKTSTRHKRSLEYERMSNMSYSLYEKTKDESFKKIAEDYGYAAITKDNFLNPEERKALVKTIEPTKDLENFFKSKDFIYIHTTPLNPLEFRWKNKNFTKKWRYYLSLTRRFGFYVCGSAIAILPLSYKEILPDIILLGLANQPKSILILLAIYFITLGFSISYFNLTSGVKLKIANELIKKHTIK